MLTATAARILDEMLKENASPESTFEGTLDADQCKAIRMAIRSLNMETTEDEKGIEK